MLSFFVFGFFRLAYAIQVRHIAPCAEFLWNHHVAFVHERALTQSLN